MTSTNNATTFGDAISQLPSTWPAGITYNPNEDKFLYSVNPNWLINPLDHFFVLGIDAVDPVVHTMQIQLPIIGTLPLNSRMYYFYVSQSNYGDVLQFIVTPLSGDTVNGDPVSASFTLNGRKKLFIAIAVHGNFVIHEFGGNGLLEGPPTNQFINIPHTGLFTWGAPKVPIAPWPHATSRLTGVYKYNPVPVANTSYPGMDGYITVTDTVPGAYGCPGFICQHAGRYRITSNFTNLVLTCDNPQQPNTLYDSGIQVLNSTGTTTKDIALSNIYIGVGTTANLQCFSGNTSKIFHLDVGDVIVALFGVPPSGTSMTGWDSTTQPNGPSYVTFEYLNGDIPGGILSLMSAFDGVTPPEPFSAFSAPGDTVSPPVAPSLAMRAAESVGVPVSSSSSADISPMHAKLPTHKIKEIQKKVQVLKADEQQKKAYSGAPPSSSSSSSSSSYSSSGISLQDIEKIVSQAMSAQAQQKELNKKLKRQDDALAASAPPQKRKRPSPSKEKEKEPAEKEKVEEEIL